MISKEQVRGMDSERAVLLFYLDRYFPYMLYRDSDYLETLNADEILFINRYDKVMSQKGYIPKSEPTDLLSDLRDYYRACCSGLVYNRA